MSLVRIKVCGITSPADAELVAGCGAHAIGLVFWPHSPRAVDVAMARDILAVLPSFIVRVGVFVNATREELRRVADGAGLDVLQLHGDEPPEFLHDLPRRPIKALRVEPGFSPKTVDRYLDCSSGILLDSGTESIPGGSGVACDWSVARAVRGRAPHLILAGGLHAGNVAQAIATAWPDAVDVSSGVESAPGRKDPEKLRAFIEAVQRSETELSPLVVESCAKWPRS